MNKKVESNQRNQRIQVFARCRPLNGIENKSSHSVVEVNTEKKKIGVKDRNAKREFFFDQVFPPDTAQISVYKAVVEPLIQEVLMGYNCTVFAYGQTGTGKTYTMEGERNNSNLSWEADPGAGIIPRSLHQLFEDLNKEENMEFSVRVSFLELYNEELFDLLNSSELSKLRLFEDSSKKGSVIIQGLEEIIVNSKDEVYSILEKGTARRQTAATILNAASSRSHTVFSVTVYIKENTIEGEELVKTGKLNLVDLAGSENVGRSGAVDKRAREAGNINQSLLTLGRVITALIEKQPHVPYRESKLTRLLQDSLGGHTKTSIIATISPAQCNFDETISTLDYATKAKSITIKPEVNQKTTKRALIREYTEEIERLRKDLAAAHSKDGFFVDKDNYTFLLKEIDEKKNLIKDLSEKIEALKEENLKIEEMFKVTKEGLTLTCEKLNKTSQKYEETASKLSSTECVLSHTQKILSETALQRDEKQFLINIQHNTEKKLSQQAKKLLHVADEITDDVERLHAKLDRKVTIEKTNEEKCEEFKNIFQEQFALLNKLFSNSEKDQAANLLKTKKNIDNILQSMLHHHKKSTDFLNLFLNSVISNTKKVSDCFAAINDSQMKWNNSLLNEMKKKKEDFVNKQCLFLLEILPKFVQKMNANSFAIQEWICNIHEQLSQKVETEKNILYQRSNQRKELQNSVQSSLDSLCKSYDMMLQNFKTQSSNISIVEDELEKDLDEKLNILIEIAEKRKKLRKTISERDNFMITSIQQNTMKFEDVQKSLTKLQNTECSIKEDETNLNQMLAIINIDEFFIKQNSLTESQKVVVSEFEKFSKEMQKDEENVFSGAESSLKNHLLSLSQDMQSLNRNIAESNSSLEMSVEFEKTCIEKNIDKIKKIVEKVNCDICESQEALLSTDNQLKDKIQKMNFELKKFIPDGLVKDIPTGTTPQRKNYSYPRHLAATSPHDRILQRFYSELKADTANALNLPLNSSFNESEESTVSLDKSIDVDKKVEYPSSDDSSCYDTDSCHSSVSGSSIDRKNKENKKKTSRLPKKISNKGFLKPALPLTRKPLGASNSGSVESFTELP